MPGENRSIPKIGDEVDVTVESIAFGGDGVTRHNEYVLFVPDVIPGERLQVSIAAAKRSYGRGVPIRIIEPSPDRIEPTCGVYGLCGGCQYQHVAYERSLEFKVQQLKEVLVRIGNLSAEEMCDPIRPAPEPFGYRNVISLRVRKGEKGWQVGYAARDNRTFVPISHCPIAGRAINEAIADMDTALGDLKHPDRIKDVTIKQAGEQLLIFPGYHGPFRAASEERLCYRYKPHVFYYGARSFFQVNHAMIPDLIDLACEGLDPAPGETLLDLYAGVGLFSIALADKYRRVVGIEAGREAVECFQDNIGENGLRNVTVVRGFVEEKTEEVGREIEGKAVSALVDPPREGMKERAIQFLKEAPIRKLVYVSCDPSTLARDLKMLGGSYSLRKITPLDMFPQTKHIEAVAVLEQIPGIG